MTIRDFLTCLLLFSLPVFSSSRKLFVKKDTKTNFRQLTSNFLVEGFWQEANYQKILRTVFTDYQVVTGKKGNVIRIGSKYEIENPKRSIRGCLICTEDTGDAILLFALRLDPKGAGHWNSIILCAVIREHKRVYDLLHKSIIGPSKQYPGETGYYEINDVRTVRLLGQNMVIFEYTFGDSISTPRGWHTITKLITFTGSYMPKEVWSFETKYSFSGASQPQKRKIVRYRFKDVNCDGHKEICINTTTIENDLFIWNGSGFVKPKIYPIETGQK